jgi:hypothetical protein
MILGDTPRGPYKRGFTPKRTNLGGLKRTSLGQSLYCRQRYEMWFT